MTERDNRPPDEGQRSGRGQSEYKSVQWEDLYSFAQVAADFGIPPERWEVPAVRTFIEVNRRVRVLKGMLEGADWATEPAWARESGPHGTPSLEERFLVVAQLAAVADIVLKDGFKYRSVARSEGDRQFVGDLLTPVAEHYGLKVVDAKEGQRRDPHTNDDGIDVRATPGSPLKQLPDTPKDR